MGLLGRYVPRSAAGYGDFSADSVPEQLVCLSAMFLGLLLYGYVLSMMAATLANQDAPRVRFIEKIIALKVFMSNHELHKDLQELVRNYMQ